MSDVHRYGTLIIAVTLIGLLFYPVTTTVGSYTAEAHLLETEEDIEIGINVDASSIDFGRIPAQASTAERPLSVTNTGDEPHELYLRATGNISELIYFQPGSTRLGPGETANITVGIRRQANTHGYYTGHVHIHREEQLWQTLD